MLVVAALALIYMTSCAFNDLRPDCFYGPDEDCTIAVSGAGWANATAFETKRCSSSTDRYCDYLTIHGTRFSDDGGALSSGAGVAVSEGTEITWHSDYSVRASGFEVCGTLAPQQDAAEAHCIFCQDPSDGATSVVIPEATLRLSLIHI